MIIPNNIYVFLIIVTLFVFPANCDTGFKTHCANFFVKEIAGLNSMKNGVVNKCNDFLMTKNLNETNGCVWCSNRLTYNLYDMNKIDNVSEVMISVCMGSNLTCETQYSDDSETLFTEFFDSVKTQENLRNLSGLDVELTRVETEKDAAPPSDAIQASIVQKTGQALTYKISTTLDYPVKCFKALDTYKPEFPNGSLYYILKPKTTNRVFTEFFKSSDYDCQSYSLYLKCIPVPYQDNINLFTEYTLLSVKHETTGTKCEYTEGLQSEIEPEEEKPLQKEDVPTLLTKNPMNDNSEEVSKVVSQQPDEQLETIKNISTDLKTSSSSSVKFSDSMNSIIKANEIIEVVNCKQLEEENQQKSCNNTKEEIQKECWNNIDNSISNKKSVVESLDPESEDFEDNTKILYQTIIKSFKNPETFDQSTKKQAISLTAQTLQESLELLQKIDDNTYISDKIKVKSDIINLIAAAASSVLQVVHEELSKDDFVSEKEQDQVRLSMKTVSRVLLTNNVEDKQLNNVEFKCFKEDAALNEENGLTFSYPNQGIEVNVPSEYVKKKYTKENIIGFCVIKYQNYPFITSKGRESFYKHVLSVEAISDNEEKNVVKVEKLEEGSKLSISYRQNFLNISNVTYENCFLFDFESQNEPKSKNTKVSTDEVFFTCTCDKFGDILVGNYKESNGLPGYAVALIVIFSLLAVGGVVGFLCWKFGLHKKVINFFRGGEKVDKVHDLKPSDREIVEKRIEFSARSKTNMMNTSNNLK